MSAADRRRRLIQVLWNLRGLGLFLIGPVVGVWTVAATFGMPPGLQIAAALMFLFSVGIYAVLARGEWRRISGGH